jgi:hypothetical protein
MNKAELIDKLAKDAGITKTQANDALDSFTGSVTAALKKGDRVTLVGFKPARLLKLKHAKCLNLKQVKSFLLRSAVKNNLRLFYSQKSRSVKFPAFLYFCQ